MRLFVTAFVVATTCLSCSDSTKAPDATPASVTKNVGPDGDVIEVSGATVTIPRGALAAPIAITISASADGVPDGFEAISKVFKCEPSGTNFAQPVTMKMPFVDDGKPSTMFWSSPANPEFTDVGGSAAGGTMSATVMHFSSGFVGRKK